MPRRPRPPRPPLAAGLLIALSAPGLLAQAPVDAPDAIEAPSAIVGAELFSSGARVTRECEVPPAVGVHTLRVGPLPAILADASLQAEGADHLRVLSVQVERRSGGDRARPEFIELEARLEALTAERTRLGRRYQEASARRGRYADLDVSAPPRSEGDVAPPAVDPESWERFLDLVSRGMTAAGDEMLALERELEASRRALEALQSELIELATPGRRESATAIIAVQNRSGAAGRLRLTYEVPVALWYPEYAVRIDPDALRLEVWCYGVVHQRTGEDWPEVPIRFSTSIPEQGADMPELVSQRIRRDRFADEGWISADADEIAPESKMQEESRAKSPARRPALARTRGSVREFADDKRVATSTNLSLIESLDSISDLPTEGVVSFGEVLELARFELGRRQSDAPTFTGIPQGCVLPSESSRGFLRTYASARPEAVPSDGAPHRLLLSRLELPFLEERTAVPELSEHVFRRLRATLTGEDPLLSGSAAVFLDGAYLGESRLPTTAPAEEIELDLGVDERISLVRRREDREEDIGVFSKGRRYHTEVTVDLVNLHPDAKIIELRERMPFTENEKITITFDRRGTEPAPTTRKEASGLLTWTVTIPPGEERTVRLKYHLDAPRSYQLTRAPAPERLEEDDR